MHVLVNNGNILYGPAEYSAQMIKYTLINDLEILPENLPAIPAKLATPDESITIDAETSVLPVEMVYPALNSKIEQLAGPFWTIDSVNGKAIGTYETAPKPLDAVKNELKAQVAANRYAEETKDFPITVGGVDAVVEGSRENKTVTMLAYNAMPAGSTANWKFPKSGNFALLAKEDIGLIVAAFVSQTQAAFDWESAKSAEIDACTTLAELDAVILEANPTNHETPVI